MRQWSLLIPLSLLRICIGPGAWEVSIWFFLMANFMRVAVVPHFDRHKKWGQMRLVNFPKVTQLAGKPRLTTPNPEHSGSCVNYPGVAHVQEADSTRTCLSSTVETSPSGLQSIPVTGQLGLNLETAHHNERKIFSNHICNSVTENWFYLLRIKSINMKKWICNCSDVL